MEIAEKIDPRISRSSITPDLTIDRFPPSHEQIVRWKRSVLGHSFGDIAKGEFSRIGFLNLLYLLHGKFNEIVFVPEEIKIKSGIGDGITITKDDYNIPVEDLNLSTRANNGLRRGFVTTIGALLSSTNSEILDIKYIGRKSFNEIKEKVQEKLAELGLVKQETP